MVLTKWIALPLVLLLATVLVVSYVLGFSEYSFWLVPLIVALAILYVLHPEIDRWYVRKNPLSLPRGMLRFIEDHLPAYRLLDSAQKKEFESAASIFLKNTTFMPQAFERVPEDMKVVLAANAHILTAFRPEWHKKYADYENIVIYRHPFPTPQFPKYLHSSELYVQDRVLLFCADHFMKAFRFPQQFFNTAMYEWAKVLFIDKTPEFEVNLQALPEVSGFQNSVIVDYVGLPEPYIQWEAVATTYFFTFPVRYKMHMENSYEKISEYFGVDPMKLMNIRG
jgi:Mlc titration factor MtfA (ptsG expression regulator)